jgi:ribosomal 50S subunit-recycling heat shock protein
MRMDVFLHRTGIIRRRSQARDACQDGRVTLDGRSTKPAAQVRPGNIIRVQTRSEVSSWKILILPNRSVSKKERSDYVDSIPCEGSSLISRLESSATACDEAHGVDAE